MDSHGCVDAWRRMIVCLEVRGCCHLLPKTVQLNISISWPTIAGEDWEPHSLFEKLLLRLYWFVSSSSSVPWMLLVVSTCPPTSETWHCRVKVEQGCPLCPLPTRRCPPARRQVRVTGAARMAPWWTPLGFFCKDFSLWWLSARWCVSMTRGLLCVRYLTPAADGTEQSSNSITRLIKCDIDLSWKGPGP